MKKYVLYFIVLILVSFSEAFAQSPEFVRWYGKGVEAQKANDLREANRCFKKAQSLLRPTDDSHVKEWIQNSVRMSSLILVWDSLHTLSTNYASNHKYQDAIATYEKEIAVMDSLGWQTMIPKIRDGIALQYLSMGIDYSKNGSILQAKLNIQKALQEASAESKTWFAAHRWMGRMLDIEATELSVREGHEDEVIDLWEGAERHFDTAKCVGEAMKIRIDRAKKIISSGQTEKASALLHRVASECEGVDTLQSYRGRALLYLGEIASNNQEYNAAINYLEEAYSLLDKSGEKVAAYAFGAANQMFKLFKYEIGDTITAVKWKARAEKKKKEQNDFVAGVDSKRNPNLWNNVEAYIEIMDRVVSAQHEIDFGDIDKGISDLTSLIDEISQIEGFPTEELATCYHSRAWSWSKKKDYCKAAQDDRSALSVLYTGVATEAGEKAKCSSWYLLANCLWRCGQKEEALVAADSCVTITERTYGPNHIETMSAWDLRGNLAANAGLRNLALVCMTHSYDIIRANIVRNFAYLTSQERFYYWSRYSPTVRQMAVFAHGLGDHESAFTDTLYNAQLLSKGLLLSTESALRNSINANKQLSDIFDSIRALRSRTEDENIARNEADRMNEMADKMERGLVEKVSELHSFMDFLQVGVDDIKKKLPSNSAAVEFLEYPGRGDSTMTAALVLLPKEKHVRFVPLFTNEATFASDRKDLADGTFRLSQQVWGRLGKELTGVQTVYFAPAGELHNIGIEYLPDYADSTRRIGDRWTLHRLSSTRELALNKEKYSRGSSAVYGGLQYDADKQVLQRDSKRHPSRNREWLPTNIDDTLVSRSGAEYLPGTRLEAIEIDSTLREAHVDNLLYTDTLGTEASFKALDGQHKSLLHVSTHGFYWTPQEALWHTNIKTIDFQLNDDKAQQMEDKALTRSGLLMAGANNALKGGIMPDSVDDGILTAKEIAELDLRGLDMVVLSACQTGLGDVSGEGVFGLQRGFKKAGAQSILMSLWKVDDRATQLLMTRFYHNWMSGMSKKKALTEAQEYLRNYMETRTEAEEATDDGLALEDNRRYKTVTVKPYTSPRYWAAFILLDALD